MPGYWDHPAWSLLAHTLRDRPTFQSTLLNLHVEIKHVYCLTSDPITGFKETSLAKMQTKTSKRCRKALQLDLVTCPTASVLTQRRDDSDSVCRRVSIQASNDLNHLQIRRERIGDYFECGGWGRTKASACETSWMQYRLSQFLSYSPP